MRSFLAAVLVLISLVLTLVAVPAIWLDRNVVQESGFTALAAPLGQNQAFQQGLSAALASTAGSQLNLPAPLASLAEPLIQKAATSVTNDPGYPEAWTQTLSRSHQLMFAPAAQNSTASPDLQLDVAPLVDLVAKQATAQAGTTIPTPNHVLVTVGNSQQREIIGKLSTVGNAGYPLAAGAAVALLLGLLFARRRSTTLLLAGIGFGIVVACWKVAEYFADTMLRSTNGSTSLSSLFANQFDAIAEQSVDKWATWLLIAALIMVLVGFVCRVFGRKPARRW